MPQAAQALQSEQITNSVAPVPQDLQAQASAGARGGVANIAAEADLTSAFQMFNQMSQQLADSYSVLENRVSELSEELSSVTAQRMSELAEKEQIANRLESLLNFLPGGVVVLDASGRVSESNPVAREMLGEPLEGLLWRTVIERCFAPRQDDGHEVSTRDGRRISIATRSLDQDGQIILLTDQTETRHLQAELSRHERLSALGKMVSALAHQIRTPLSAAMLYTGHLCNPNLAVEKRQQFSEKVLKRLNHMERQVQDMLLFVKGELPLNDWVSVDELQRELAEEMEVVISTSRAQCSWSNHCGKFLIHCHREALIGALLNLVNNAVQAVDCNARIHIRFTSIDDENLAISVLDQGPGIAPELMQTVKDLFVTTKPQGTGLGLAVVQAVAKAHRGRFILKSRPEKGTCATLVLPIADVVRESVPGDSELSVAIGC